MTCYFYFLIKTEGLVEVADAGQHIHSSIWEMVQDRDVVITDD